MLMKIEESEESHQSTNILQAVTVVWRPRMFTLERKKSIYLVYEGDMKPGWQMCSQTESHQQYLGSSRRNQFQSDPKQRF